MTQNIWSWKCITDDEIASYIYRFTSFNLGTKWEGGLSYLCMKGSLNLNHNGGFYLIDK